jgi:hypothetical protein
MFEKGLIFSQALEFEFVLESYGVRVKIQASSRELLQGAERTARDALLGRLKIIENIEAEHTFAVSAGPDGTVYLWLNGEQVTYDTSRPRLFKFFDSLLRITIAEHAIGKVFVHAGVVGWKDLGIVIPAKSFSGKTTLVNELIRNGADYYSDEYAILDEAGLVQTFPRDLSIRYIDGGTREKRINPELIGAKVGARPIRIGMVLLTEFVENAKWEPQRLTIGQGIMEMIPHTIPRRFNPEFSLKVLNTAVSDAIILKSARGDAAEFAVEVLAFFDKFINLAKIT